LKKTPDCNKNNFRPKNLKNKLYVACTKKGEKPNLINVEKKIRKDCFTTMTLTITIGYTNKTVASNESC